MPFTKDFERNNEEWLKMLKRGNEKGFTLIEVMTVVAITSVVASIAIPHFADYKTRTCDTSALREAKHAFTASQSYFHDYPSDTITSLSDLTPHGFVQTSSVNVTVSGNQDTLQITTHHEAGSKTYTVDYEGAVSS